MRFLRPSDTRIGFQGCSGLARQFADVKSIRRCSGKLLQRNAMNGNFAFVLRQSLWKEYARLFAIAVDFQNQIGFAGRMFAGSFEEDVIRA